MAEILSMGHPTYRSLVNKGAEVNHSSLYSIRGMDDIAKCCRGQVAHQAFYSSDGTKKVDRYVDENGNSITYGSELTNDEWQTYFINTHKIKSKKDNKSFLSETYKMNGSEPMALVHCCKKSKDGNSSLNAMYMRLDRDGFSEKPRGELFEIKEGKIKNVTPIKYHTKKGTQLDLPIKYVFSDEYKKGKKMVNVFRDCYENHDSENSLRPIDSDYLQYLYFESDGEENI